MAALRSEEVLELYLDTLAHVYDPHSDYLGHEQMESLSIAMNLSLFGIGASLETEDGYCKVRELLPGGPAARSGQLKPGDRIVAVAQGHKEPVDIVNMPLSRTVELIRGPKGSTVTLTIIPSGGAAGAPTKTTSLVRDEITLEDQQAKARIIDLPAPKAATATATAIRRGTTASPTARAAATTTVTAPAATPAITTSATRPPEGRPGPWGAPWHISPRSHVTSPPARCDMPPGPE